MTFSRHLIRTIAVISFLCALPSASRGQTPTNTWADIATGAYSWSDATKWDVAPAIGGSNSAILQFNATGANAYTANNDLAGTFVLNGLLLNSSSTGLTTISGNQLEFQTDPVGPTLPVLNQNSSGAVTISNALLLTNNLTLGGTGEGLVTLSGAITGAGTLTMNNSVGEVVLSNASNTYAGTTITAGRLAATAVGARRHQRG